MPAEIPQSARGPAGVRMIRPQDGKPVTVPEDAVDRFLVKGYTFEGVASRGLRADKQALEANYGGTAETVRTFAEGAIDTVIPGLTGTLFEDAGKRAQANPAARGAGALTGLGLGMLGMPGATGTLLKKTGEFAAKATTPAGILTRNAIAGGIEGGLFGAAQEITEAQLTDKPLTAEAVAGGLLTGSALGFGVGALGGSISAGLKAREMKQVRSIGRVFDEAEPTGAALKGAADDYLTGLDDAVTKTRSVKEFEIPGTAGGKVPDEEIPGLDAFLSYDKAKAAKMDAAGKRAYREQYRAEAKAKRKAWIEENAAKAESVPPGRGAAMESGPLGLVDDTVREARDAYKAALGTKAQPTTDDFLRVVATGQIDDVAKVIKAQSDYSKAVKAAIKGDPERIALLEAQEQAFVNAISSRVDDVVGKTGSLEKMPTGKVLLEVAGLEAALSILPEEDLLGPVGTALLQVGLVNRAIGQATGKRGIVGGLLKSFMGRAGEARVRSVARAKGLPADLQFGMGAVTNLAVRKGVGKVLDKDLGALVRTQLKAQGRIGRAVKYPAKVLKRPSFSLVAHQAFAGLMEPQELAEIKAAKTDGQKFLAQMKVARKLQGNPNLLQKKIFDMTAGIAAISPEVAEYARAAAHKKFEFLVSKMPMNPGSMKTFVGDRWVPNPQEVAKWTRYAEAAMDPAGVIERAMASRLTPEAAEALKALDPAHFAEMQRQLLGNPDVVAKMEKDFALRINLGTLFEVATDPTIPIYPQLQKHHEVLQEQAAQAGQTPQPPSTGLNQPTGPQMLSQPRLNP